MKKIILLFIFSFCLLSQLALGQTVVSSDVMYTVEDFSGMLTSHVSPYLIKKNSALQALNVRPNEEFGSLVKRQTTLLLSTAPTSAVKSLYRYYKSDNTKYTIATYSTFVSYIDDSGAETKLYQTASDSKRWSFVTYKDFAIGTNGTDNAKKWDGKTQVTANTDGSRTDGDLVADLGAPFAELNTGANLDASSWYQYKIAFFDGTNYTYSNARSNPILTGATVRNITLTDIPLGPSGTTHRYIFRTDGNASRTAVVADTTFKMVYDLADNTTTTWNDTVADGSVLTPLWSTVDDGTEVTPPKAKFALINTERLFLANDPSGTESGKSTIYWSDTLNPDYFNIYVDYDLVRPDDGDEITFIKNLLGILTVGKTRSISKFYTTASDSADWKISDPITFVGCIAPYSAVNSPGGIMYVGRYGLYLFNGQYSQIISDSVTDQVRNILATSIEEVSGIFHDNRYLISYTSAETGSGVNDRILVLDSVRNAFYVDTLGVDSFAAFDSGDDFGTLYSGSSGTDGNIYSHETSFSALTYRYKSQLEAGTPDSIYVNGTEENPLITLGDASLWSEETGSWQDSGTITWMIEDLTGYWYSPVIKVSASALDKLYWNESLGTHGDVTFAVRTGATTSDTLSASFSSEFSTPIGSDISGVTANDYLQIRAKLSSSVYTETPALYIEDSFLTRLTYKQSGTTGESSILSLYESGYSDFDAGELPKRIKEIQIYYEATNGTLNFAYENDEGDSYDFDVDLSISPSMSTDDSYFGTNEQKIYVYFPQFEDTPLGRHWKFTITENGTEQWTIRRIIVRADVLSYTTFK